MMVLEIVLGTSEFSIMYVGIGLVGKLSTMRCVNCLLTVASSSILRIRDHPYFTPVTTCRASKLFSVLFVSVKTKKKNTYFCFTNLLKILWSPDGCGVALDGHLVIEPTYFSKLYILKEMI